MRMMGYEVGPIRPPSEAGSLLIRVTRNCPWNRCKFCNLYREQKFQTRPVEDIKADIDSIRSLYGNDIPESVFLQDANTAVLSYNKLREILIYLREKLPRVKRVTSYGRVDSLSKFSVAELKGLKEAGLDRIHSGFESGSDKVLALINKGYTKAQEIEAGRKVKEAGIELSVYYMPGVGGKDLSDDNATETADVVNKTNPDFVRIRTFVSKPGTELYENIESGVMRECTDKEKLSELKKMIENLDGADGFLYSDHTINLLQNVRGNMKTDKGKMLSVIGAFEELSPEEQRRYQLARRAGVYGVREEELDLLLLKLDTEEKFEGFLLEYLRQFI